MTYKRQDRDPRTGLRWAPGCGPLEAPMPVVVGVDVGQQSDPSAIVVAEAEPDERYVGRYQFRVRHLERLPLGTRYPAVSQRIVEVVLGIKRRDLQAVADLGVEPDERIPKRDLGVLLDATGVGRGPYDIVSDDLRGLGVRCVACTFTFGSRIASSGTGRNSGLSVGKAALVSRLQALLQTERVKFPASHPEAAALVRELETYEIKVSDAGNDTYGAFSTGSHDDLATALGLAVLLDPVPNRLARVRRVA